MFIKNKVDLKEKRERETAPRSADIAIAELTLAQVQAQQETDAAIAELSMAIAQISGGIK